MRQARSAMALVGLIVIGLLVGVWQFISPWVIGFPGTGPGPWSAVVWSSTWTAALVIGASALALVIVSAASAQAALRAAGSRAEQEQAGRDGQR